MAGYRIDDRWGPGLVGPAYLGIMLRSIRWRPASLACAFTIVNAVSAGHIIGGELFYDHLGDGQYQITLRLYRDCNGTGAEFDAIGYITVFTGDGAFYQNLNVPYPGSTFIPVELESPCLTLPPDLCIETTSYVTTVQLPANSTGYHISYQRCCRQPAIVNLLNSVDLGLTCTTQIPPQGNEQNGSPRFNSLPPAALCLDQPLVFDHSAADPDGDQLVYSLTTPFHGADDLVPYPTQSEPPPYQPVTWSPGYNADHQIDSEPLMAIDPVTGVLTLRPTVQGNFVMAVSAKEYRNGVLLSETIRDYLFSVVPCDAEVEASIVPQAIFCTGDLTVNFMNNSQGGQTWAWDFGDPVIGDDISTEQDPSWTYPSFGTYTATLIAEPGQVCADTTQVTYALYPAPEPYFVVPDTACGPVVMDLFARGQGFGPDALIGWDLGPNATPSTATGAEVAVEFSANGPHPVILTVAENGCTGSFTASIVNSPQPVAFISGTPASPLPAGADIVFMDASNMNGAQISDIEWFLDGNVVQMGGTDWAWNDAGPGNHVITLAISTIDGCTSTYELPYVIIPDDILVPNVFTPNNDGSNDALVIENVQFYGNTLRIYNRWGQIVFEAVNYRNQWRATDIPDGTYYLVLHLDDGREITGHLSLLR